MALFPDIPYGVLQSTDLSSIGVPPPYKYEIKRATNQRVVRLEFDNLSSQRFAKGTPLTQLTFQWKKIPTTQKNFLRYFYDQQQGQTLPFAFSFDGVGYAGCRFGADFKADNVSHGLWNVTLEIKTPNTIGVNSIGAGARVIVPAAGTPHTVMVGWNGQWNQRQSAYADGAILISFDGSGGATMTYVASSGGAGSTGVPSGNYYNKWGYNGTWYVEPNGPLGVGPVSIGTGFVAGQEIILQMSTTGGPTTASGTTYITGPGWNNSDGEEHAATLLTT